MERIVVAVVEPGVRATASSGFKSLTVGASWAEDVSESTPAWSHKTYHVAMSSLACCEPSKRQRTSESSAAGVADLPSPHRPEPANALLPSSFSALDFDQTFIIPSLRAWGDHTAVGTDPAKPSRAQCRNVFK